MRACQLVCILSDGTFDSPYWKQELCAAYHAGVEIVLVVKEVLATLCRPVPFHTLLWPPLTSPLRGWLLLGRAPAGPTSTASPLTSSPQRSSSNQALTGAYTGFLVPLPLHTTHGVRVRMPCSQAECGRARRLQVG